MDLTKFKYNQVLQIFFSGYLDNAFFYPVKKYLGLTQNLDGLKKIFSRNKCYKLSFSFPIMFSIFISEYNIQKI